MDYSTFIQSVVSLIENRLEEEITSAVIEHATGFSYPHARDIFSKCTTIPLGKYIGFRRISNAAFELAHTDKSIISISQKYGFECYDTFTRAFRRVTGMTPSEFRKSRTEVGRIVLTAGVFGPGILRNELVHGSLRPELEERTNMKKSQQTKDSCILYGVPKVEYGTEGCTPFPLTLKACLNYMGQEISYTYLMAASGAAFRLRWKKNEWFGGNVGISFIYEDRNEAYRRAFEAAGRSYRILDRTQYTKKLEFIEFFRHEIDEGRPVIGIGIIGPAEACIITGYRENGNALLGWNFFQNRPEFTKDVTIDESGYFVCKTWWENPETIALISVGEEKKSGTSTKDIVQNAYQILMRESIGDFAGGQEAFNAWAAALSDDSQFREGTVQPLLFERLMCQIDAGDMVGEGRYFAAGYMEMLADQYEAIRPECLEAAKYFKFESGVPQKMCALLGGYQMGEEQAKRLADPAIRKEIVRMIYDAKELEQKASGYVMQILSKLQ